MLRRTSFLDRRRGFTSALHEHATLHRGEFGALRTVREANGLRSISGDPFTWDDAETLRSKRRTGAVGRRVCGSGPGRTWGENGHRVIA